MVLVAACQVQVAIDDPQRTWQAVTTAARAAAHAGAEVVVLPELALTGSAFASRAEALERAEEANGPTATRMSQLAAELGLVLIFGFCERDAGGTGPYNSALLIDPDGRIAATRRGPVDDKFMRENVTPLLRED